VILKRTSSGSIGVDNKISGERWWRERSRASHARDLAIRVRVGGGGGGGGSKEERDAPIMIHCGRSAVITDEEGIEPRCWRAGESWRSAGERRISVDLARAIASARADNRRPRVYPREIGIERAAKFPQRADNESRRWSRRRALSRSPFNDFGTSLHCEKDTSSRTSWEYINLFVSANKSCNLYIFNLTPLLQSHVQISD